MESAGHFFHVPRQLDIETGDATGIMGGQVYGDSIVDICPIRMMIHLFRDGRYGGHKGEGAGKVRKLVLSVELPGSDRPSGYRRERGSDFLR